ncbi:hypothetical protein C8A05DRAFT_17792 [Staphylotrichum tortipilum]|uniref:Uncharacterized protein n=1 Tax=Staphylotrichum tortipilum TaxID=2831512 RepID=A0AAN6MGN7_9PEZI|nr:hypothetical protein C8A05DRAFT_17792 [Staphylotrichum longicolle]
MYDDASCAPATGSGGAHPINHARRVSSCVLLVLKYLSEQTDRGRPSCSQAPLSFLAAQAPWAPSLPSAPGFATAILIMAPSTGSLLALPTAFVQPETCSNIFSTTVLTPTVTSTHVISHSTTLVSTVYEVRITVSDPAAPRFTTCQPPGWASVAPESRFVFSPAVCPSGWKAYDLRTFGATSTAYCCASGYFLDNPSWVRVDDVESRACFKPVTPPADNPSAEAFPSPTDVMVHNAYRISWQASDTATMSPQPPDLTCGTMYTWVPGSPVTSSPCPTHYNDSPISDGVAVFLKIGLPIIVVLGVAGLAGLCCYYPYKEREAKRIQARRAARAAREQDEAIEAGRAEARAEAARAAASPSQS